MKHPLDNPIYHALKSNHHHFSVGTENVRFYNREIAHFAGMKDYSEKDFEELFQYADLEGVFIIFSPSAIEIPENWQLIREIDMFQLVYEQDTQPEGIKEIELINLKENHVEEMIALVELTKPGPFLSKTIDLSNYTGVFNNGKLIAMAGHRFHANDYIEISAVCTHPDHLGKGYAYEVIREQVRRILEKSQIPFLHVRNDNIGAVKLYQKLGFKIRIDMKAYVICKA
ncbi:MAG: GNAT family N-acetyltransferase [Pelobium sp.]